MEDKENKYTTNYGLYLLDNDFKNATNLIKYIQEAQDFYNGNQYPDDNDNNMIRVTMNFCSFSTNLKAAKIVGTQRYITYTADNSDYDCSKLQRFDEYNISKLDEKTEDFQSALDGFNNGTALVCYVWDADDTSYKGIYKGGLRLEQLDVLSFAVANPRLKDIQNQKWVMFWKDEDVMAVRDLVERKSEKALEIIRKKIVPDNEQEYKENVNHGLVRVFTRFFRIDGEVFFMCSTKDVDLFEYPHALNPKINKKIMDHCKQIVDDYNDNNLSNEERENFDKVEDYKIDYQDIVMNIIKNENFTDEEYKETKEKFYLYPFAEYIPYKIKNSFYGRSDVKDMIPIQKGVNFILSMVLKCVENNAYNKIFAKEGALNGQEITNEPGQVITDYTRLSNGWGIKFAESQPMPNGVIDFADRLFTMTRIVYGFNDVMDGSVSNQDISGYAVQQMIKQANSSIEQQQQLFWKFCKDKAAIRLMFYRFYVDSAKYTFELEDYEVEEKENARKILSQRQKQLKSEGKELEIGDIPLDKKTTKVQIREFKGEELYGTSFDISIDVMQGLADSKLAESQMWDTLIMNGNIQNMSPELLQMYLEANPTVSERTKAKLKAIVKKQMSSENYALKQQLAQMNDVLQKMIQYAKELEAQNGYKTNYINNIEKEFVNKINVANKTINAQNKIINGVNTVSEGEGKSNNARGVSGSNITNDGNNA